MVNIEIQLLTLLRTLVEVAGWFLIARGALFLLAGARRQTNIVYQFLVIVTRPVLCATRFITPSLIVDKHIPFVAFFVLFWLWILLAFVRNTLCQASGLVCA